MVYFGNEGSQHRLGNIKIGNHAVFHRADGDDVAGGASEHRLGFVTHGEHVFGAGLDGDNGGFAQHDAFIFQENQRVGGSEIDTNVIGKQAFDTFKHSVRLAVGRR